MYYIKECKQSDTIASANTYELAQAIATMVCKESQKYTIWFENFYICGIMSFTEYKEQYVVLLPNLEIIYDYGSDLKGARECAREACVKYENTAVVLYAEKMHDMYKYNRADNTARHCI